MANNATTVYYDTKEYRAFRDLSVNVSYGVAGLLVVLFNSSLLWVYFRKPHIRKHFTALMLSLFSFCVFHGFMTGITYPLHRVNRYTHNDFLCVLGVLVMEFCDNFVIILCMFLAVERLLSMIRPLMKKHIARRWSIGGIVTSIIIVVLCVWMPMIPHAVGEAEKLEHQHSAAQSWQRKFYLAYSCNEKINRRNFASLAFMLCLYVIASIVIIGCYVFMYLNVRFNILNSYRAVSDNRKKTLNRFAVSVFTLSAAFLILTLPYGIWVNLEAFCGVTFDKNGAFCKRIWLQWRFGLGCVMHISNCVAPMVFAFQTKPIRNAYLNYYCCRKLSEESSIRSESEKLENVVTVDLKNEQVQIKGLEDEHTI